MNPELLHIGPFTLYSYGVMVALAAVVGSLWVAKRAKDARQDADLYLQTIFWIILIGFAGARLLYVFYFPEIYLENPLQILLDRGGLVWYGGVISGLIAAVVFLRVNKMSLPVFGDIYALPAVLALAIGRIGCFLSGCCYGKPTDSMFGVQFPHFHETYPLVVHPTQLYESAALLLFLPLLMAIEKRSKTPGTTMGVFFIGIGVIRFVIEYFRGDGIYWVPNLFTASQVISLLVILGGIITLAVVKRLPAPHSETVSAC